MKRDPAPSPAMVATATAEMLTAAGKAGANIADPVAARDAIRAALAPLWPHVPPEAARDVLVAAAALAWDHGIRAVPAGLADQTAEWLLEMTGEVKTGALADPGPGGFSPPVAFASSVAFDRAEDAETFTSVAALLALALAVPDGADDDPGPGAPSPWGHPEPPRADDPDEPTNREVEPDPADWHDGPEPDDYDPGPEVDDQGGMSERGPASAAEVWWGSGEGWH